MEVVPSAAAVGDAAGGADLHNLLTASTDGRLCTWSLSMLVHPVEYVDLKRGTRDFNVYSMTNVYKQVNQCFVGGEDGSLCKVTTHGSKPGILETFESHDGMITSIANHPHAELETGYSDLIATASMDWTVRILDPSRGGDIMALEGFEEVSGS